MTAATTPSERFRLGYRPALDGVRGLAILLVIARHYGVEQPSMARVGVTLFFVLSGFLITSLLLQEYRKHGSVSLRAFYLRRIRRLLPALVAVVVVVTVAGGPILSSLIALAYLSNFAAAAGYHLGALNPTWSLAIEEQFYLLWPLAFLALMGRWPHRAVPILFAVIGSSIVLRHVTEGWLYLGPFDRADALLAGCALAFAPRIGRRWLGPGLLMIFVLSLVPEPGTRTILLPLAALASVLVVGASMHDGPLGWAPLASVGRISYGLYLWHIPALYLVMAMAGEGPIQVVMAATVTVAVSAASYRWVESPFLHKLPALERRVGEHGGIAGVQRILRPLKLKVAGGRAVGDKSRGDDDALPGGVAGEVSGRAAAFHDQVGPGPISDVEEVGSSPPESRARRDRERQLDVGR